MMADNSSTSSFRLRATLARLLIAAGIAIGVDQAIGLVSSQLYEDTREGDFGGCINLTLEQRNEVVVFGSSRAKHHYIPSLLEENTGTSFFNAGIDAQGILCHYGILELILDEYAPQAVVLDLNTEDIRYRAGSTSLDKLSVLLPYYSRDNEALNSLLLKRSKFERLKLLSRSYPYNSQLLPLVKYTMNPDSAGTVQSRGYVPYHGSDVLDIVEIASESEVKAVPTQTPVADQFHLKVLRDFVSAAKQRDVKVIACLGPLWAKQGQDLINHDAMVEVYETVLAEMNVPLVRIDSTTETAFRDPKLYKDRIHLNQEGAELFSQVLAERIQPLLSSEHASLD